MAIDQWNAETTPVQTAILAMVTWAVVTMVLSYVFGRSLLVSNLMACLGAVTFGVVIYVVESGQFE
ncbi:hypothetical protein [Halalkalicoccus jeotgali]|uniref:Uncharacterized protein n=1 Tax=Halalkalicoccus jeotgali (strain DSM 18796 / CECT 7217 / JCM 14584 / KCTC 4019 / B3) TaxID=795797 RepID=D8J6S0_HALJB|nr:hypothetical protein [Halalkalicoccus jeotgali]ADJ15873.1 hypothetical protein HacjB3_12460 [Halalkalicoccus jeotgali B3]ELY37969.1 hypothetical protein C497_07654 [Halalkalicoccus jeotgali B3]